MSERIYDLDIFAYNQIFYADITYTHSFRLNLFNIMKSSNINPSVCKMLRTGNIFFDKTLVVCNNFITFASVKQKSYGFIIQKK